MDMSLDEIINTRKLNKRSGLRRDIIKRQEVSRQQFNGRNNRRGITRPNSLGPTRRVLNRHEITRPNSLNRRGLNRPVSGQTSSSRKNQIHDARTKIIEKNREKVTDARDRLAEIAKKSDARLKILKLKDKNVKITSRSSPVRSTTMKNNILRTKISNTPIQNIRSSNRDSRGNIRGGRAALRGRGRTGGRGGSGFRKESGRIDISERLRESPRGTDLKRSINNDLIVRNRNTGFTSASAFDEEQFFQGSGFRSQFGSTGNDKSNWDLEEIRGNDGLLMRTFSNQRSRQEMDNLPMKMARPDQIKVVMHNDSAMFLQKPSQMMDIAEDYDSYFKRPSGPLTLAKSSRNDYYQGDGPRMSQEMMARLDTPAQVPRSMGIFSAQRSQPVSMNSDLGHRIVVSNLQQSVTHEDIKELFEDIGPLLASRVVRPGTAEVIYSLQKDAKKAVEAYHNRQLDGQPMKCMLVNPRAMPVNTSLLNIRPPALQAKIPNSSKSSVTPDLSCIHKALFNK